MSVKKSRRYCEICGVRERHLENPRFFANFPLEETRCREWVRVTGNEDLVHLPIEKLHQNKHICVEHFKKTQINKSHTRLKKRAVPCLNLLCTPLSDDQMLGFPLHMWNKQVTEETPSTSKEGQQGANEETARPAQSQETDIPGITATALKEGKRSANEDTARPAQSQETDIPGITATALKEGKRSANEETARPAQPQNACELKSIETQRSHQIQSKGEKRKLLDNEEELSPRKKKLVERLVKTQCTLKSLKKSATLIEDIQSPVLKELVINSCKNEKKKPKGRRWTTKNKLSCLAILKRSPKTYRYLSAVVTLPCTRTLQNILKKVPMTPGMNKPVLTHLKVVAEGKELQDRTCNLAFDEMALKSRLFLNEGNDIVEGYEDLGELGRSNELADHALVFLLQGIRQKFKQPIAFYLTKGTISSANLAQMIKTIIVQVTSCGFTVVNTVCDQGPTNIGALRLLREASGPYEDASNHYFKVDGKKVFIIYDIPHLFKSLRNNFLNAGCVDMNGVKGKWAHLVEVESLNRDFLYLSKISQAHVNPKYKGKMRVKLAAQALSNTVSAVLKLLARAEKGKRAEELLNTADVVEKLDRLFDVSNGPSGLLDMKKGLRNNVSDKSRHMERWADYIKILRNTKFIGRNGMPLKNVKCVDGYIISLKSLRDIWMTVKDLGFRYLNLRNLNQDALENLFGVIRQHSPTNRNPTATHFIAALKTAVVTGLTAPHSRGANCEQDKKSLLTNFHSLVFGDETLTAKEDQLPVTNTRTEETIDALQLGEMPEACEDNFFVLPEDEELENDFSLLSEQPTVYVAGYLARQVLKKVSCETCEQNFIVKNPGDNPMYSYIFLREWWQTKFSLTYPSANFCQTVKSLVVITEKELLPQMHKPNICLLGCILFEVGSPNSCFSCKIHGSLLKTACFKTTCKLLIRRQCQRINQSLALNEEHLASVNKRAEQQGKAK